jgi:hypothetical protein
MKDQTKIWRRGAGVLVGGLRKHRKGGAIPAAGGLPQGKSRLGWKHVFSNRTRVSGVRNTKEWYGRSIYGVVERRHTTKHEERGKRPSLRRPEVAFVRRKGNAYYLVHNVRQRGKVKQLHLACLGTRPRITDDVIRDVSRQHPFLDLNWKRLQEQIAHSVELYKPDSSSVHRLMQLVQTLNLDLADLSPTLLQMAQAPATTQELVELLRLLRGTLEAKLHQFARRPEAQFANARGIGR